MSDIPHLGFILAAYAVTTILLAATVVAVILDGRAQRRTLARLERATRTEGRTSP